MRERSHQLTSELAYCYTIGMTMKRDAKAGMTEKIKGILSGEIKVISYSPRQMREFGQYLPAGYAAEFEARHIRQSGGKGQSREGWSNDRRGRRATERKA